MDGRFVVWDLTSLSEFPYQKEEKKKPRKKRRKE